jgi:uncharacterized membrane protein
MWKLPWTRWAIVLGFALGGFFDGILLHQILQWHHLLSLVPGVSDMRLQVLWDGYFHALMYVIAAVALWGLWRAHKHSGEAWGRPLVGALLVGFGVWHIVDSVASHWVLGIHRIKLDSPNPLVWDLIWFTAFGAVPLVIGWLLARGGRQPTSGLRGSAAAVLVLLGLTGAAGVWSLKPPPDQPFTTVVFAPGVSAQAAMAAVGAAGARLVWTDPSMGVLVVAVADEAKWRFYRHGALLVSGSGLPSGCYDWSGA